MKLVFINRYFHPDHSATSQLLGDLAFDLAAVAGREICVVTSRQLYDDRTARLPARELVGRVEIRRVWTTSFGRDRLVGRALDYLSFYVAAALALWQVTRRGDVIVAETDPPLISVVAALIARLRGARLVNWVQDAFPEVAQALGVRVPFAPVLRRLRDWSMRTAATNVVLGERMAEWARNRGIPDRSIVVIPNWADGAAIHPLDSADNRLRQELGLVGKLVVGYSGNLGRAHDYETVLGAADLLRCDADIVFVVIGGGHHRATLEAEVNARGLENFRFLPYQPREQLQQSLGLADVHWMSLVPALEGLIVPSKIYGVLAAGRPALMVGDADGEIGRMLRRRECGVTVAPGQHKELVEAIVRLRDAPEVCNAMGRRARVASDAHYSRGRAFEAWDALLARLGPG